ncbi:MAG: hypothetical protein FJX34_04910 [Alphaproteobacteria bacterium]|nr:hypothetical protein [Alphaproteobacteria bacterium]
MDKEELLKKSLNHFRDSSSLIPKIGCELEFFLLTKKQSEVEEFISDLQNEGLEVEKERGATQIELKTDFTADLKSLCLQVEEQKKIVKNLAAKRNLAASFTAQPFADDCGNALQFNISLHDKADKNLFSADEKLLQNSVNSLLSHTNQMLIFLVPNSDDYRRFSRELNQKLFARGKFTAPTNLSFGFDNRSCAIRIAKGKSGKRLEYRVAAASADPWCCISVILLALICKPEVEFRPVFGNAFEEKYLATSLCQTIEEAKESWDGKSAVRKKYNSLFFD